uniref:Thioredoxin domain-containing protein n=1 Tax=Entomoneis paludosa TaxID=265537 RepID=A0A7S2YRJ2_9STRA
MKLLLTLFSCLSVATAFSPMLCTGVAPFTSSTTAKTTALGLSAATDAATDEVKVGDAIPNVEMKELVTGAEGGPTSIQLSELIAGKKVAIFGVPGAFTPGCSKSHLPSFMDAQEELKAKGVDLTICVATNDPFVMEAWGRTSGGSDAGIRFLSDAAGDLTKELGLVMDTPVGMRTKRFSLIAEDGVVTHYFNAEEEVSNTWAPSVLEAL